MNYHLDAIVIPSFGNYQWCYNKGKYVLSGNGNEGSRMVKVIVTMNKKLFEETDVVEIIDETGFLAQYTTSILASTQITLFFQLKYVDFDTDLTVNCRKFVPCDINKIFSRHPMTTIESIKVHIPALTTKGEDKCTICLEEILKNDNKKHVTECQHIFHEKCLIHYLEKTNHSCQFNCRPICKHESTYKNFNCPNCKQKLETI